MKRFTDKLEKAKREHQERIVLANKKYERTKFVCKNLTIPDNLDINPYGLLGVPISRVRWFTSGDIKNDARILVVWLKMEKHMLKNHASEEEKRNILADVMTHYQCLFNDPEPSSTERHFEGYEPSSIYKGIGKINGYRVGIRFDAPWPPVECEWEEVVETKTKLICREK